MTPPEIGLLGVASLIVLVLGRIPIGAAMGLVGLVGYAAVAGWDRALIVLGSTPYNLINYSLSVLPLFIFMGMVATSAGMSRELFMAANSLFAGRRGALAMATIGACAGFSAVSGSSLATAATFSRIAVPEMKSFGYDDRLAAGSVAVGGTLGILIPPSIILIIYGIAAKQSVPHLFAAALFPGVVLALLFVVSVWLIARVRPGWAPASPRIPWRERLIHLVRMWKLAVLFGLAVCGIYAGWFSPTQAAGISAFAAIVIALSTGTLKAAHFRTSVLGSVRTTAMLFLIMTGAWMFAYFIGQTQLPEGVIAFIQSAHMAPWQVIGVMLAFYVALGCVLESVSILLITVPVFLPVVIQLGYDPVWYGVLMVVVVEIGLITPPVGLNLFVIHAQLPEIGLDKVIRGAIPFLAADVVLVLLLLVFPDLALWLPRFLY